MLSKLFGSRNQRLINQFKRRVNSINNLEDKMKALTDAELTAKTDEFKKRIETGDSVDKLLEEAFAVVREASVRVLGMRHFDVQLIGGMVLNSGKISEMRTGEGKTLVATLPAYLNALTGEPVHVITVNDYLAQRDADWMGKVFTFLGMTVGTTLHGQDPETKRNAYAADIVYGTNNEYGFDYLRDNMAFDKSQRVQRGLGFAVIDEVDSILIDEARTPLIISGPAEDSTELYIKINELVAQLKRQETEDGPGDFTVEEKERQVALTEEGHETVETLYADNGVIAEGSSLYDAANITALHHTHASLRARNLFKKDVDYIVRDKKIVIIDEFTGRAMEGRRWSEGLHQAVEAKEGVPIQAENQTLASITFQNYFRLYTKLSGMTGTADTEAPEFQEIYGLEVVIVPTNKPTIRDDRADKVYRTVEEKFQAILDQIKECQQLKQPVLVGTSSIDTSEILSQFLTKEGIKHEVLNAKQHEREALIVADAGRPSAITIATNMAGRGTDIVLGGNLEMELKGVDDKVEYDAVSKDWAERHDLVKTAGGLFVIGTERNESRRVDNQLRGRSGRQGDPGASQFYLSLDDNLMRLFGSDRLAGLMTKLGMEEGESIEHPWVNKAIENAQRKVEGRNFDIRKQLLEYDDVANEQRRVVYEERNRIMDVDDLSEDLNDIKDEVVDIVVSDFIPPNSLEEQWEIDELQHELLEQFGLEVDVKGWLADDKNIDDFGITEKVRQLFDGRMAERKQKYGEDVIRQVQKGIMLQTLDQQWKEHLGNMDHLRQGIGLRGYGQKNPKQEYKREAFELFTEMLEDVKLETMSVLMRVQLRTQEDVEREQREISEAQLKMREQLQAQHPSADKESVDGAPVEGPAKASGQAPIVKGDRIGRNEPCPCGSGKKYKHCHGKLA